MVRPDILVVGGGIVGQVTAITLAQDGAGVTIVDAARNAGSTANAGSLHVQMQSRFMRLYPDQVANIEASLPLYRAASAEWAVLDETHGPFDLVRKGGLMLAETTGQLAFLEQKAERESLQGLDVDILNRAALDRIAPWLSADVIGAELCRDEGKLNPLAANTRLRSVAAGLGVRFVTDRIREIKTTETGMTARGTKGTYDADRVVIAAAWGAGRLASGLGVTLPTAAEPLHMNITEPCAAEVCHLVQHAERSITLKQFHTGQIVIGGGWPALDRGETTPPEVLAPSLLGNVALAARLVPAIGATRVIRTWAGMNTTTDGASIIGPLPGSERVIMAVPGDAGYTLGPLVALMAAACVLGTEAPCDPAPFSPKRFA